MSGKVATFLKSDISRRTQLIVGALVCVFTGIWFWLASSNGLIIGGDTAQYLSMARDWAAGNIPEIGKWNPGYSFLIAMVSELFDQPLLEAARISNLFLCVMNAGLIGLLLRRLGIRKTILWLLVYAVLFLWMNYRVQSLTAMAELPFVTVLLVYVIVASFIPWEKKGNGIFIWAIGLALAGVLLYSVKVNAVAFLFATGIWAWAQKTNVQRRVAVLSIFYLVLIGICYGLYHGVTGPMADSVYQTSVSTIAQNISIELGNLGQVVMGFAFNSVEMYEPNLLFTFLGIVFFVVLIFLLVRAFRAWHKENTLANNLLFLLTLSALLYLISYFMITAITSPQVNHRTVFFPMFILIFVLIGSLQHQLLVKMAKDLVFFILFTNMAFGTVKLSTGLFQKPSNENRNSRTPYSNSATLEGLKEHIAKEHIDPQSIWSDDPKIMGIYLGNMVLQPLPENQRWAGNKSYYLSGDSLAMARENFATQWCSKEKSIVVLVNEKARLQDYEKLLNSKCKTRIKSFSDGVLILRDAVAAQ